MSAHSSSVCHKTIHRCLDLSNGAALPDFDNSSRINDTTSVGSFPNHCVKVFGMFVLFLDELHFQRIRSIEVLLNSGLL